MPKRTVRSLRTRVVRATVLLTAAAAAMTGLTACQADTYASQCAYVVGNGAGDNHKLKEIVYPGTKVNTGDDDVKLVPCNSRNFIVTNKTDVGDRHDPAVAKTGDGTDGTPSTSMNVYLSAFWSLNQSKRAMTEFLPFCEKYDCFETSNDADKANFSSAGWNGMLRENFSFALDRSVADAMGDFQPNVWNDRSQWTKLADDISSHFAAEMRTRTGSSADFFCGNGGEGRNGSRDGKCTPVRFSIDNVTPSDSAVVSAYNQTVLAEQEAATAKAQETANEAQLKAAEARYGDNAPYVLGELDIIKACGDSHATCVVGDGSGTSPSVSVPTSK